MSALRVAWLSFPGKTQSACFSSARQRAVSAWVRRASAVTTTPGGARRPAGRAHHWDLVGLRPHALLRQDEPLPAEDGAQEGRGRLRPAVPPPQGLYLEGRSRRRMPIELTFRDRKTHLGVRGLRLEVESPSGWAA